MKYQYPLEYGDIAPRENATLAVQETRYDGLADGIHTGNKWIYQGEFYKPLDAKPFPNAEGRFDTQEDIALAALHLVHPLFQSNWRVEILNGRRWLVRPVCQLITPREYLEMLGKAGLLEIETAIREMNNAGWKINDTITIAFDPTIDNFFILDLSSAQEIDWKPDLHDEERDTVLKFWKASGANQLVGLRNKAHHPLTFALWSLEHPRHKWVYASFNRPVSKMWATLPETAILVHQDRAEWDNGIPWTWVITEEPLSGETIYSYELEPGYFPWFSKKD